MGPLLLTTLALVLSAFVGASPVPGAEELTYRLPRDVLPHRYNIILAPNIKPDEFNFDGYMVLDVEVVKATQTITLHANDLMIDNSTIKVEMENTELSYVEVKEEKIQHFYSLVFENPLEPGNYTITMNYTGFLRDDMYGFYRSSYTSGTETRWIAATQFQPTHARRAFPCFDEPNFKATFVITIMTPEGYHSLSNMPVKNKTEHVGYTEYIFEETPIMSSYLIAFVVSDFVEIDTTGNTFNTWARAEAINDNQGKYSQDLGPKLLDVLENYTAIDYMLPKTDQVALTDFAAGAMENWGLITYRETALLYHSDLSTASAKQRVATVVAHELVHMWFGNLVTLDWWSYTWLNEGFARYFQYYTTSKVETTWNLMDQFVVVEQQGIFGTDALATAFPLTNECNTPAEVSAMFGTISYSKGGSILRMISHVLSEETFQAGLKNYLSASEYGNVKPDDLFSELEKQAANDKVLANGVTITEVMKSWTEKAGYPVINVNREYNEKTATVNQERFLLIGEDKTIKWWVPLQWTSKSKGIAGFTNTKPTAWIKGTESESISNIAEADEWVIFNIQEAGYYRVNYDDNNWGLITNQLSSEERTDIHELNRAQLVDDALNLARAGKLKYAIALNVVSSLEQETSYAPLASFFRALSFLERRMDGAEGYDNFKRFIGELVGTLYEKFGFDNADTNHVEKLTRNSVLTWACNIGNENCVKEANSKFDAFLENQEQNPVLADIQSVVYCQGLQNADQAKWDKMFDRYKQSNVAAEQVLIMTALGCAKDDIIIDNYLAMSINETSGIRKQDAASVFSAVYANSENVLNALNFLENKFDDIRTFYGGMGAINNVVTGIASQLSDKDQIAQFTKFIDSKVTELAGAGKNAKETVQANQAWTETYSIEITRWLTDRYSSSATTTVVNVTLLTITVLLVWMW